MKKDGRGLPKSLPQPLIGCFSIPAWLEPRSHPGWEGEEAPGRGAPFAGTDGKEEAGGEEAGGGGQVTRVILNATIGPDDSRGQAIKRIRGGASQEEDQAHSWRQGSLQRISTERPYEEALEVLAGDSDSP